jgi:hypothetical protein
MTAGRRRVMLVLLSRIANLRRDVIAAHRAQRLADGIDKALL